DFGRTGQQHVFYDHARLEREIALMFVSASGDPVRDLLRLYPNLPKAEEIDPKDSELLKAVAAIRKIRELAKNVSLPSSGDWEKEYYSAVFAQFLFTAGNPSADFGQEGGTQTTALRMAALKVCESLRPVIESKLRTAAPID